MCRKITTYWLLNLEFCVEFMCLLGMIFRVVSGTLTLFLLVEIISFEIIVATDDIENCFLG